MHCTINVTRRQLRYLTTHAHNHLALLLHYVPVNYLQITVSVVLNNALFRVSDLLGHMSKSG